MSCAAVPLIVKAPIVATLPPEKTVTKHNMNVHARLDKPVYFAEDAPIKIKVTLVRTRPPSCISAHP